ncbi:hypothetical protein EJ065_6377 [Corallococcus coralloides]|uniref:Uncharacterized protein n=1 Tax=Corallococcus coralloides TaxID=184914 RepID=A0A410S1G5_CORCK|nr:hypothetical protein EJ065_6377 [Corallococcus coralloides]
MHDARQASDTHAVHLACGAASWARSSKTCRTVGQVSADRAERGPRATFVKPVGQSDRFPLIGRRGGPLARTLKPVGQQDRFLLSGRQGPRATELQTCRTGSRGAEGREVHPGHGGQKPVGQGSAGRQGRRLTPGMGFQNLSDSRTGSFGAPLTGHPRGVLTFSLKGTSFAPQDWCSQGEVPSVRDRGAHVFPGLGIQKRLRPSLAETCQARAPWMQWRVRATRCSRPWRTRGGALRRSRPTRSCTRTRRSCPPRWRR